MEEEVEEEEVEEEGQVVWLITPAGGGGEGAVKFVHPPEWCTEGSWIGHVWDLKREEKNKKSILTQTMSLK